MSATEQFQFPRECWINFYDKGRRGLVHTEKELAIEAGKPEKPGASFKSIYRIHVILKNR